MSYRIVDEAEFFPSYCIVTQRGDGPFVDTGANVTDIDPHVYLKVDVAKDIARCVGMVDQSELDTALARVAELEEQVTEMKEKVTEWERGFEAIDFFESKGMRARKKTGRPPKREGVAA
jgi:hypothetical protein